MDFYVDAVSLWDGRGLLYKRARPDGTVSPIWHMRLKIPRYPYVIRSSNTPDYNEAFAVAKGLLSDLEYRARNGIPQKDVTFDAYWQEWFKRCYGHSNRAYGKAHAANYRKYFSEYFGKKLLNEITHDYAHEYFNWRHTTWPEEKRAAKNPNRKGAKSVTTFNAKPHPSDKTLDMEKTCLNEIFRAAYKSKRMTFELKLAYKKTSHLISRRPYFTLEEWKLLRDSLEDWARYVDGGRVNPWIKHCRVRLYCFVMVGEGSGLRPDEMFKIRWEDYSEEEKENDKGTLLCLLQVPKDTKKGRGRQVVCKEGTEIYLELWRHAIKEYAGQDPSPQDLIFGHIENKTFHEQLRKIPYKSRPDGLLRDSDGDKRVFYSLRHTYATDRLLYGKMNINDLANNIGTSVKMIEDHYGHATNRQMAPRLVLDRRPAKVWQDIGAGDADELIARIYNKGPAVWESL